MFTLITPKGNFKAFRDPCFRMLPPLPAGCPTQLWPAHSSPASGARCRGPEALGFGAFPEGFDILKQPGSPRECYSFRSLIRLGLQTGTKPYSDHANWTQGPKWPARSAEMGRPNVRNIPLPKTTVEVRRTRSCSSQPA